MARWNPFPYEADAYRYDLAALRAAWPRLHAGDAEACPGDDEVLQAWALYHAGEFEAAVAAGLRTASPDGVTVANKAQAMQANYLERSECQRFALFLEVVARAESQVEEEPHNANAHYLLAYSLGRYAQGISIAKALQLGLGVRIKAALDTTIRLQPQHADAHTALGAFHAEVIDTMGALLGRTQGASKDEGVSMFRTGLRLNPMSAIARVEYANGLVMLEGETKLRDAEKLYAEAAECVPLDAAERLHVEVARAELAL
jgi:tetratricopeptide (TPR) repeat protein